MFDTEVYGARAGGGGVTNVAISPDGRTLAISLHRSGTERWMLRFRDVERGRDLRLSVDAVGPNAAWVSDKRVLLSQVDATGRPVSIHRFDLEAGLGPSIFAAQHVNVWLSIGQLADGLHAVVSGQDLWLAGPETTTALTRIDVPNGSEPAGMSYCGARRQMVVHMLEDDSTESLHVALIADGSLGSWREVHRAEPTETIESITAHDDAIVVLTRQRGVPSIMLIGYDREQTRRIGIPNADVATTVEVYDTATPSTPNSVHIAVRTPVDPGSIHALEPSTGALEHHDTLVGPDRWERAGLVSRVDWVRSDDGAEVPLTIVHPVDLPTPAPTILYGYGAYGVSSRPTPNADAMYWLSRGWVLAFAHVRGGGELGPCWHRAGSDKLKGRSIADFVACAQHLVAAGTTSPSQLAARGGSAGGLLVCGAAVRRPDLFAAVVAHNPVTDVIEFLADHTGRLAGIGINEFGDIFNHHDVYEAVKRYNPYDNVTFNDYPAFLFTTGREDERVPWWHAARLALRLRAFNTGVRPIVIDIDPIAGHTGGSRPGNHPPSRAAAFLGAVIGE